MTERGLDFKLNILSATQGRDHFSCEQSGMAAGKKHLVKFGKAEKGGKIKHYFIIAILLIKVIEYNPVKEAGPGPVDIILQMRKQAQRGE